MKAFLVFLLLCETLPARVVVFWPDGFPVVESQPVDRQRLETALRPLAPEFSATGALELIGASVLVVPHGSAFPADAWQSISGYLGRGGCLLVLGGRPLAVPVTQAGASFTVGTPEAAWPRRDTFGILRRDGRVAARYPGESN